MKTNLLGGISPEEFLATYWQKKPLLVRQAIPQFQGAVSRDDLLDLACDDEAESRLIRIEKKRWHLQHGPFELADFPRRGPWTVLVQGVNLFCDDTDRLLHSFDFIPAARLDDVMVSYATDGGGVGPHFDSYDVFLLQGMGRRRWQIGNQRDLTLIEGAPLRILKDFKPTEEFVLEPGDMLYLPPHYAHNGIAEGECMTWSIGARAPGVKELMSGFLEYLAENLELPGRYADRDLTRPRHRAEIDASMLTRIEAMGKKITWNRATLREFLGQYFTEPKAHVFFDSPARPLKAEAFEKKAQARGVRLHRKTQLLFSGAQFFINGETWSPPAADRKLLARLADARELASIAGLSNETREIFHEWYRCGYLVIAEAA